MGELVTGDDGLCAELVGEWAKEKHDYLRRYVDISRGVRGKFVKAGGAGGTFIDPFCGPCRCLVKGTGEWIDGGALVAWNESVRSGAPYSEVIVGDRDDERRAAAVARLHRAGAPVREYAGLAVDVMPAIVKSLNSYALHFAYLDPYALGALDFRLIEALSRLKRMDMLVHISKMDLQRNLDSNATASDEADFDPFSPGWRDEIDLSAGRTATRVQVVDHWRRKVAGLGIWPSTEMKLVKTTAGQHLYWLLLAAKHELAHKFWKVASDTDEQGAFAF